MLIAMLFVISLSLLIGVVKVRAREPRCPCPFLLFTPADGQCWVPRRGGGGCVRRSHLHAGDLHIYLLANHVSP